MDHSNSLHMLIYMASNYLPSKQYRLSHQAPAQIIEDISYLLLYFMRRLFTAAISVTGLNTVIALQALG